jgi:hypothetical protein
MAGAAVFMAIFSSAQSKMTLAWQHWLAVSAMARCLVSHGLQYRRSAIG